MVRRILETGTSVYSGVEAVAWGAAAAEADEEDGLNFSTSSLRMRPSGPEPLTSLREIPRSRAIFFAIGEAKRRSPLTSSALFAAGGVGASSFGGGGGLSSFFGGSWVCDLGAEGADLAKSAAAERSSPSSATTAMTEPTWTFLEPSCVCECVQQM